MKIIILGVCACVFIVALLWAGYTAGMAEQREKFHKEVDSMARSISGEGWTYEGNLSHREIALLYSIGKSRRAPWEHLAVTSDSLMSIFINGELAMPNTKGFNVWGKDFRGWQVYVEGEVEDFVATSLNEGEEQ